MGILDAHRLPQHKIQYFGRKKTRPIIIKLQSTFDKSLIFKNAKKLKTFNEARQISNPRSSKIYITKHLPKLSAEQKKALNTQFKKAREDNKKTEWKIVNAEYCLFVNGKRVYNTDR